MPDPLVIRRAAPEDLPRVLEIERRCYGIPWPRRAFEQELARQSEGFVVVQAAPEGPIVAFLVYWVLPDELHVLNVAVDPAARRQGLGRRLMDLAAAEALAQGRGQVLLEVRPGNAPARALYESLGFRQVGRRRAYYDDGEDALVLVKDLDPLPTGQP